VALISPVGKTQAGLGMGISNLYLQVSYTGMSMKKIYRIRKWPQKLPRAWTRVFIVPASTSFPEQQNIVLQKSAGVSVPHRQFNEAL